MLRRRQQEYFGYRKEWHALRNLVVYKEDFFIKFESLELEGRF